jgi:AhpD family alkylhydroperoxidase
MTRIEGVPSRRAGLFAKFAYRSTRRQFGRMMDPVSVYAHAPTLLAGYGAYEQATARQHRVPERLKVLGEVKAAAVVSCEFCVDIASHIAREAGITEAQLLAMPNYRESDEFDELEKLVLDYASAISRTPARVGDELFAALRERFDERELVELTNAIALENMRARFNSAFDMTPAGFSEGMVCVAPERPESATAAALATDPAAALGTAGSSAAATLAAGAAAASPAKAATAGVPSAA